MQGGLPTDYTKLVPDELLDSIIRGTGPLHDTALSRGSPEKRNWLSCASVCHRWHRITLPYTMRCVRVATGPRADPSDTPTANNFHSFLQENPSVMPLIQEVIFISVIMDTDVLCSIIDRLPNLQCLAVYHSIIEPAEKYAQDSMVERKITKLVYLGRVCEIIDCSPAVCGEQETRLLSLFSAVGEFEDLRGCCHDEEISAAGGDVPQIRSFKSYYELQHLSTLRQLHLLDSLTCLRLRIPGRFTGLSKSLDEFLYATGGTLQELQLSYVQRLGQRSYETRSEFPSVVANTVRRGLTACRSLHGFRLEIRLWLAHSKGFSITEGKGLEMFYLGFLVGMKVISLLNVHYIKHLSFRCDTAAYADRYSPEDIRALDWAQLRRLCRSFARLRSFTLQVFDKEEPEHRFRAVARDELRDLKGLILYGEPGTFYRCDEESCAWYSRGRLNRMISVQHDYHKED